MSDLPTHDRDVLVLEGRVLSEHRGDMFTVEVTMAGARRTVLARRSGRMNFRRVRVLVGDTVSIEVSPYDLTRGRIVFRTRMDP